MGTSDPVTELIKALAAKPKGPLAGTPAAGPTDRLADAAELIPGRSSTAVEDLLDSPELQQFRRSYVAGVVEAHLIDEMIALVKTALSARGWL